VARAEANIGKPYYLFAQNCEHFASFAFTGQAKSETVKAVGWMALGVLAVALAAD
jgi:triosephosphate isomerase